MLTCLSTLPKLDSLNDPRPHQDHESLLRKPTQSVYEKPISTEPRSSMPKALKYLIQLCKGKNFAIFIAVSLLQGIGSYWLLMITTKLVRSNSTNNYDLPTRSQLLHIKIMQWCVPLIPLESKGPLGGSPYWVKLSDQVSQSNMWPSYTNHEVRKLAQQSFPLSFQFKLHAFIPRSPFAKPISRLFLSAGDGHKAGFS